MFAALRGFSGKDTALYVLRFDAFELRSLTFSIDSEFVLTAIIFLAKDVLGSGVEVFFALQALLLCAIYALAISRFDSARIYLMTIGPMFLIDGMTNGMRISLAYHFFILGVLLRAQLTAFFLAFFSHVSAPLIYLFTVGLKYLDRHRTTVIIAVLYFAACSCFPIGSA